jgi:hypothetical protein
MQWKSLFLLAGLILAAQAFAADLNVDWAYHDDADGRDDRAIEKVPDQTFCFLGNGSTNIADADTVTLYVLTANQFAGDADEQVFVRWWNGSEENWIMGGWVTNLNLGTGDNTVGPFHNQPEGWSVMVDLWKIEISPDTTRPGPNYYVIQLKGWKDNAATEYYLLRDSSGEQGRENNINQAWSEAPEYSGHDWSVNIKK